MRPYRSSFRTITGLLVTAAAVAGAWTLVTGQSQVPTFRSGVDLIAVDVQVVDGTGKPIPSLTPINFDVTIAGKRRRVVSADYIESTRLDGASLKMEPSDKNVKKETKAKKILTGTNLLAWVWSGRHRPDVRAGLRYRQF